MDSQNEGRELSRLRSRQFRTASLQEAASAPQPLTTPAAAAQPLPKPSMPPAGPMAAGSVSPPPVPEAGPHLRPPSPPSLLEVARKHILPLVEKRISLDEMKNSSRGIIARRVTVILNEWLSATGQELNLIDQRNIVTFLINAVVEKVQASQAATPAPAASPPGSGTATNIFVHQPEQNKPAVTYRASSTGQMHKESVLAAKTKIQSILMNRIDSVAAASLPRAELSAQMHEVVSTILMEQRLQLNRQERDELIQLLLNDMLGLGPMEPLLRDETITDILINGPNQVYVERFGKLELSDVTFRDNQHLMNISSRIVSQVGRRIDESSPMVDARLADGSRVNIIIPPLALDGISMSIRKFSTREITLPKMVAQGNMSAEMGTVLQIAARSRLNIIISGGTGSGKTTLLNALSQMIEHGERIVTVEDSAELRLQQPHVVRLETRPANLEGDGEISIRDLIKNALRMRPDRIIVGECRGGEIIDMFQAMNTGHDGSMSTVHANNPRTCLTRMENMLNMAGFNMPEKVTRSMISSAVDMIVQVRRMRDGVRRITHVVEVMGMEESTIITQDLFWFEFKEETADGKLVGRYVSSGLRPHFMKKAEYYGLAKPLLEAMN